VGSFKSIATFGYSYLSSLGDYDIFVAKLDQTGNWVWASQAGGVQKDYGYDIVTAVSGDSYVTGYFKETAYFGSSNITSSGSYDIFVAKLGNDGAWQWASDAGGTDWDEGHGIDLDGDENCYTAGFFRGTASFGATPLTSTGGTETFVAKLGDNVTSDPEIGYDFRSISLYPNPISNHITIRYSLKEENHISFKVYNINGQLTNTLLEKNIQPGDYSYTWNCQNIPPGVYFLKIKAGSEEQVIKFVLLK